MDISDTVDRLRTLSCSPHELCVAFLPVPGEQAELAAAPITNQVFAELLSGLDVDNSSDGGYRYFNPYNPDQPLHQRGRQYLVRAGYEPHPVVGVTVFGAALIAEALGGRLPTVGEWQAAAGACDGARYPWGDAEPEPGRANYAELVGATSVAGRYPATGLGYLDLGGNVGEWCLDLAGAEPLDRGRSPQQLAELARRHEFAVVGGGWNKPASQLTSTARRYKWGRIGTVSIGMRIARDRAER